MTTLNYETFATVLKMRFFLSTVPPARNRRDSKPAYEVLDENGLLIGRGRTEDDAIRKSLRKAQQLVQDAGR